jgi:hypothetical protein
MALTPFANVANRLLVDARTSSRSVVAGRSVYVIGGSLPGSGLATVERASFE